ncbi:MAG: site-specific integrase [Acholeplasmataceae bacterium]|jgi:integrase|nr:site-specific integrase [Acholeplasmataceae bacterium]
MEIKHLITQYLEYSKRYKTEGTHRFNLSESRAIILALDYLKISTVDDLNEFTVDNLVDYFKTKTQKKNSKINSTISWLYRVLRYFEIKSNLPKQRKLYNDTINFKPIQIDERKKILEYIMMLNSDVGNNLSYQLVIFLMFESGVRSNELLNIKIENVDLNQQTIYLDKTKNGKPRTVYFNNLSHPFIVKMLSKRKRGYLLWNFIRNERFNKRALDYLIFKLKNVLSIQKLSAHMFRKTFATELNKNGCPVTTIMKLLGHTTIEMTMIYLEINDDKIAKDYMRYYPEF